VFARLTTVFADTSSASLGEVEDLSSNASAMVKISALSAWAELRIASASQQFLVAVVQPHKATLNKLWVGALKDYAWMRVDGDGSSGSSNIGSLDLSQSGLGKEVLLPVSCVDSISHRQLNTSPGSAFREGCNASTGSPGTGDE
jgi:hypothetical protein